MVGGLRDVIMCAEFQIEILMGYDFTRGRIFDFPIDFSMGLTTVQRYCAACDHVLFSSAYSLMRGFLCCKQTCTVTVIHYTGRTDVS